MVLVFGVVVGVVVCGCCDVFDVVLVISLMLWL
jgi:hypothetical protein